MVQESIDKIVGECIRKWGRDSRTLEFEAVVSLWLSNVDDSDKEIYIKLLKGFSYYSKKGENDYARFIISKIKEIDSEIENTIVIPLLKQEEGISGAYKIVRSVQVIGGLHSVVCPLNLYKFEEENDINLIKNVIIVDDISGSGRTLDKSLEYMKKTYPNIFNNKSIYISFLATSEKAKSAIISRKDVEYWEYHIAKRAFDDNHIFQVCEINTVKEKVKLYEKRLSNRRDESDIFGFDNSELLIAFSDDTPNNTLLSFWKEVGQWKPIFPRAKRNRKPGWANKDKNNIKLNIIMKSS